MRGSWRPARLTSVDIIALTCGLMVASGVRAGDYATGADEAAGVSSAIEQAAPLLAWAAVLAVGGLLLATGMLTRRHGLVWAGYGVLWVVYLVLMVGVVLGALHMDSLDGIRGAGPLLVVAELHFILWLRTGVRPLPHDTPGAVEEIVSGDGASGR